MSLAVLAVVVKRAALPGLWNPRLGALVPGERVCILRGSGAGLSVAGVLVLPRVRG